MLRLKYGVNILKLSTNQHFYIQKCFVSLKTLELYKKCFLILGVPETSTQDTVRQAYIELVKKYHPDRSKDDVGAHRFHEIDTAFRILQEKFAKNRRGIDDDDHEINEAKIFDIKHTAPQHRQYLSFDGMGIGTPFQRERQYQQIKAMKAQQRVLEHRMEKAKATEGALIKKTGYFKKHAVKTKYGFDRVVEDLIQEAMSKGEFSNVSGIGKPLPNTQQQNPYVDFITHKLNNILIDNGFTPEWITLQKDIRMDIQELKDHLHEERQYLGSHPLNEMDQQQWNKICRKLEFRVDELNRQIDKFNLIVPLLDKQMFRIQFVKIAQDVLVNGKCNVKRKENVTNPSNEDNKKPDSILSLFGSFF